MRSGETSNTFYKDIITQIAYISCFLKIKIFRQGLFKVRFPKNKDLVQSGVCYRYVMNV